LSIAAKFVCRIEDIDLRNQLAKARGDLQKAIADLNDANLTMARDRQLFAKEVILAKERDDAITRLSARRQSNAWENDIAWTKWAVSG
jgi:multidrug resistance efflux pump